MTHPILAERAALCDLFEELGPDAPTMSGEWRTRQLAAHLHTREHRPDAVPGLVLGGAAARHTERLQARTAERPYEQIVSELRDGPPWFFLARWAPTFDVHEWFVHHEDVRRPAGLGPRDLGPLDPLVWDAIGRFGKQLTRKLPVGVTVEAPDGRTRTVKAGDPAVVLRGEPGELLLRLFGREAEVTVDGDPEAVAAFNDSSLGI